MFNPLIWYWICTGNRENVVIFNKLCSKQILFLSIYSSYCVPHPSDVPPDSFSDEVKLHKEIKDLFLCGSHIILLRSLFKLSHTHLHIRLKAAYFTLVDKDLFIIPTYSVLKHLNVLQLR